MAGLWADMTLPDFLSDYSMWSFLLESLSIKNEPFLPAHVQETNGTYNPSFACPLNYSRILFVSICQNKIYISSFQACAELTLPAGSNNKTDMFPPLPWTPEMISTYCQKNGMWYLNLTGHPYSSVEKVGFLKTLKYTLREFVRLKRKNFIKAGTKNRVRIDHSLCHFIWMGF